MKIIEKLKKWRKKRLEEKYFKEFPERKGMATMEIVQARVKPLTFCHKTMLDPYFHDVTAEMLAALKKDMARKLGETLLEEGMIDIRTEAFPDMLYGGRCMYAMVRVLPPAAQTTWGKGGGME